MASQRKDCKKVTEMLWGLGAGSAELLEYKANTILWTGGTAQQESLCSE